MFKRVSRRINGLLLPLLFVGLCNEARAGEARTVQFGDAPSDASIVLELSAWMPFNAQGDPGGGRECIERAFAPQSSPTTVAWKPSATPPVWVFPYIPMPFSLLCTQVPGGGPVGGGAITYYGGGGGGGLGHSGGSPMFSPFSPGSSGSAGPNDIGLSFLDPSFLELPQFDSPFDSSPQAGDGSAPFFSDPSDFSNFLLSTDSPDNGDGGDGGVRTQNTEILSDLNPTPVPEPATVLLTAAGLAYGWRKRRAQGR